MPLTQRHKKHQPSCNTVSVLLIEDDPAACQLVKRTLDRNDPNVKFELETAQDVATATKTLSQKRFDNILLDLGLPDSNGIQTVKNIHKLTPNIPIIVLTALADNNLEMQAIREGADHYLVKEGSIYQDLGKSIRFAIERKGKENKNNFKFGKSQDSRKEIDVLKKELDSVNNKCMHLEHLNDQLRNSCKESEALAKVSETKLQDKTDSQADLVHELRTPLNSIMGFSDVLSEEDVTKTQSEYIQLIQNASGSLLEIINNILDMSKIEADKLEIDSKSFCLQNFLDQLGNLLGHSATSKGIDFQIKASDDLPEYITSDPVRLRQCLVNLVGNAIKFTVRGHVHLRVLLEENGSNINLRFEVEDTGIGVAKEKQDKIFQAFVQGDLSTSANYGGTGLGLSITQKLVGMLKGRINFTSESGNGSIFSISIPLEVGHSKQIKNPDGVRTRKTGGVATPDFEGTVLVIEDDPKTRLLINLRLNDLGLDVEIAKNEVHAAEQAASGKIDVIFMSIKTIETDEINLIEKLRSEGTTVPIVAIIETPDRASIIKCIDNGCDGYLTKPIVRKELHQVLERSLQFGREPVELLSNQNEN